MKVQRHLTWLILFIIVVFISIVIVILHKQSYEGFDVSQLTNIVGVDPDMNKNIPNGYYLVIVTNVDGSTTKKMAPIPYGYALAKRNDVTQGVIPNSAATIENAIKTGNTLGEPNAVDIPATGIPSGYYKITVTDKKSGKTVDKMAPIPPRYMLIDPKDNKAGITPNNTIDITTLQKMAGVDDKLSKNADVNKKSTDAKYDANNVDLLYHNSADTAPDASKNYGIAFNDITVLDASGNKVTLPGLKTQPTITYNQPGTYTYGASSWVPNYEDSVYLSRTTQQSYMAPLHDTASMLGGFCTQYANDPTSLEAKCNTIDKDTCASTSCCVLLGGSKCVAGNEKGPAMKANYSDIFVLNRDYYYYQGKCFGNCQQ